MNPDFSTVAFAEESEASLADTLRKVLRILRQRLALFGFGFCLVVACSVIYLLQLPPRYTASATILFDPRQHEVVDLQAVISGLPSDSAALETEIRLIRSASLMQRVAADMGLITDPEFNPLLNDPSVLSQTANQIRSVISFISQAVAAPETSIFSERTSDDAQSAALNAAASILNSRLSVRRDGLTYLISVNITSEDPRKSAQLANRVAELYLDQQLETKFEAIRRANDWLSERVASLREQVETAEASVEVYRAKHGLISAEGSTLTESQIVNVSGQLANARAGLAEDTARLDSVRIRLRSGRSIDSIVNVLTSPVIQQLRAQYSQVARKKAELGSSLGPRHPDMLQVNQELQDLNQQIQAETDRIVGNLENEVLVSKQRVKTLEVSLADAQGNLAQSELARVHLRELQRDADTSRTLYESFLSRFKQTSEQEGLAQADATIVSRATPPGGPSYPQPKKILAQALIFGLMLGGALVWLAEAFDSGFRSPEDLERETGLPTLGAIPFLEESDLVIDGRKITPESYVLEKPFSAFTEALRALKASLILTNVDRQPKSILVTSAVPGEGKTLSTIVFGRTLALSGAKVLLIDADLRRAGLTKSLNIEANYGFLECIVGTAEHADVIMSDPSGADILPLSKTVHTPIDLFSSQSFRKIMKELTAKYDLVLLDSPPVHAVADTLIIAQSVDAVMVLARWHKTPRHIILSALKDLNKTKARIAGVVLSQVDRKARAGSGYGYGYGNYSTYSNYYHE